MGSACRFCLLVTISEDMQARTKWQTIFECFFLEFSWSLGCLLSIWCLNQSDLLERKCIWKCHLQNATPLMLVSTNCYLDYFLIFLKQTWVIIDITCSVLIAQHIIFMYSSKFVFCCNISQAQVNNHDLVISNILENLGKEFVWKHHLVCGIACIIEVLWVILLYFSTDTKCLYFF